MGNGRHQQPCRYQCADSAVEALRAPFRCIGEFAPAIEYSLFVVAVVFALIELAALLISLRLTRSVTGAIAQLYNATGRINEGISPTESR